MAWLHITNACNLRCDYCFVTKSPQHMSSQVGLQAVEAVFRSAQRNGFQEVKLKYAGGEPLLNFNLVLELHDHARRLAEQRGLGLDGVVLSNGVAVSEGVIAALLARGLRLAISLDGVGEHHDAQRKFADGRGSFGHIERSLERLAEGGLLPSVTVTVSQRNLAGLPKLAEYLLQRGLPFTLNFYRENDCAASFDDLAFEEEQLIAAMRQVFAVVEAHMPPHSLLGLLTDRARLDAPHERPCGVGETYLAIGHAGQIARCHMELGQPVTDVHAEDPLAAIQTATSGTQNPPVSEKEGCCECRWRYWCAGGCPALAYRVNGRYTAPSPNCRIYQALFPDVLRLEGLRLLKYAQPMPAGQPQELTAPAST